MNKFILFFIAMFLVAFTFTGCGLVTKVADKSADKIADLVVKYCAEFDQHNRTKLREKIQLELGDKGSIKVTCPGDVEPGPQSTLEFNPRSPGVSHDNVLNIVGTKSVIHQSGNVGQIPVPGDAHING